METTITVSSNGNIKANPQRQLCISATLKRKNNPQMDKNNRIGDWQGVLLWDKPTKDLASARMKKSPKSIFLETEITTVTLLRCVIIRNGSNSNNGNSNN